MLFMPEHEGAQLQATGYLGCLRPKHVLKQRCRHEA